LILGAEYGLNGTSMGRRIRAKGLVDCSAALTAIGESISDEPIDIRNSLDTKFANDVADMVRNYRSSVLHVPRTSHESCRGYVSRVRTHYMAIIGLANGQGYLPMSEVVTSVVEGLNGPDLLKITLRIELHKKNLPDLDAVQQMVVAVLKQSDDVVKELPKGCTAPTDNFLFPKNPHLLAHTVPEGKGTPPVVAGDDTAGTTKTKPPKYQGKQKKNTKEAAPDGYIWKKDGTLAIKRPNCPDGKDCMKFKTIGCLEYHHPVPFAVFKAMCLEQNAWRTANPTAVLAKPKGTTA